MPIENTLIILKPDGLKQGLEEHVLKIIEANGLVVEKMKRGRLSDEFCNAFYVSDEKQLANTGSKTLKLVGDDAVMKRLYNTLDAIEIGRTILSRYARYMASEETLIMRVSGEGAIGKMRAIIGHTDPQLAQKGTIRGDFGTDSLVKATLEGRPLRNVIHASDAEKAEMELRLAEAEFGLK